MRKLPTGSAPWKPARRTTARPRLNPRISAGFWRRLREPAAPPSSVQPHHKFRTWRFNFNPVVFSSGNQAVSSIWRPAPFKAAARCADSIHYVSCLRERLRPCCCVRTREVRSEMYKEETVDESESNSLEVPNPELCLTGASSISLLGPGPISRNGRVQTALRSPLGEGGLASG